MSKTKTYNQGVESGLKVTQKIIEQEVEVMDYLKSRFDLIVEGHDEMKSAVGRLIEDANESTIAEVFKICNPTRPKEMEEHEQIMLLNIIATLSSLQMNDLQKKYFNNLRHHLNIEGYEPDTKYDYGLIESIDSVKSIKTIAKAVRIYLYLESSNMDGVYKHEDDLFSYFGLNSRLFDEIDASIEVVDCLFGADGLVEFYGDFEDDHDEKGNGEKCSDDDENIEMTDEVISTITQIKAGEAKIYKYKSIHLKAYINCEGDLTFDHCIINYNEADAGDEITLSKDASLTITNSIVVCKGFDKTAFITCEGDTQITLDRNSFEDCSYFLKSGYNDCVFSMTNCQLHNCYENFLSIRRGDNSVIRDNNIIQDGLKSFYTKNNCSWNPTLISINGDKKKVEFCNNSILEEEEFRRAGVEKGKDENTITYFYGGDGEVRNCSFKGISQPIYALKYVECRFEKCIAAISSRHHSCIDNCVFVECTNVISTMENTQITNCQFVSCYNDIISPYDYDGGVSVEFCQFINTKNINGHSCVTFRRGKESKTRANYLKKCIFDGVELGDNFLIGAKGYEKPAGTVTHIESCDFKNCSTKRTSGKIIKEYIKYDTLFKKDIDFHANHVSECRGLDKVNKEGTETETVEIRTMSTTGNIIGSALATGVASVAIGPVASAMVVGGVAITRELIKKKH